MEREDLERRITLFQAKARGFLVRKELSSVRQDYEDIDFLWQSQKSLSKENPGEPYSASDFGNPEEDREVLRKAPGEPRAEVSSEAVQVSTDSLTPTKDCDHQEPSRSIIAMQDREASRPAEGDNDKTERTHEVGPSTESQHKVASPELGESVSVAEETSVWDSTAVDTGYSFLQRGSPRRSVVQEVPRTQEDLLSGAETEAGSVRTVEIPDDCGTHNMQIRPNLRQAVWAEMRSFFQAGAESEAVICLYTKASPIYLTEA
ncbi:hypothetical protein JZ751_003240 [Albula glossodonta]|uniref:Uncharacterized protein n=1 Tax=Albula glossodonta TaxID=121402 RepID=A0A8T2NDH1_9TELE|nr:hypothetical protein JZ751_003240 [Albula glossodonta]